MDVINEAERRALGLPTRNGMAQDEIATRPGDSLGITTSPAAL